MKTTYIKQLTLALTLCGAMAACDKNIDQPTTTPTIENAPVAITKTVAEITRAGITDGKDVAEFGLFLTNVNSTAYTYTNLKTTANSFADATGAAVTPKWKNATDMVNVVAYHPYQATVPESKVLDVDVLADQSNNTNVVASDLLFYTQSVKPSLTNTSEILNGLDRINTTDVGTLPISFEHKFSKFRIALRFSTEFTDPVIGVDDIFTTIGLALKSALSLTDGSVIGAVIKPGTNPATDIKMCLDNGGYEAIITPQEVAANQLHTIFLFNGLLYRYTHATQFQFESGKLYTLTLTVGKDKIILGGLERTNWVGVDSGNLDTESTILNY